MKYFSLPEIGSEFEVVKDLKLRVVYPKDITYYNRSNSEEDELKDATFPKGTRIKFTGISDRFSPHIKTKGVRFTKLSTKVSKGKVMFIIPFNKLEKLKNIKIVDPSEMTVSIKRTPAEKITWWRLQGVDFNVNLDPQGSQYSNPHVNAGIKEDTKKFKLATTIRFSKKRWNESHEAPCEFTMDVDIQKKTVVKGDGFQAKPVRETRVIMSNPSIKVLGKTFELTQANFSQGTAGKELSEFLLNAINKKLV
jgi:hypothetical protein